MAAKVVRIRVPEWMDAAEAERIIEEFLRARGNLELLLAFRGAEFDEEALKEVGRLFELLKRSLTRR